MLTKILCICALMTCGFIGLQAEDQVIQPSNEMTGCKGGNCGGKKKDRHLSANEMTGCKGGNCGKKKDRQLSSTEMAGCKGGNCGGKKKDRHIACKHKDKKDKKDKDLSPGVMICNCTEDKCKKDGTKGETESSSLFAVFQDDKEFVLACKNCN
jgi:hypothetical protein